MTALIAETTADRIYWEVLTPAYRDSCTIHEADSRPIRLCICQGGQCGHCQAGRHGQCQTRLHGPTVGYETHLLNRKGAALTVVKLSGTPCRWMCSCPTCTGEPAAAPVTDPPAYLQDSLFPTSPEARHETPRRTRPPRRERPLPAGSLFDLLDPGP